MKTAAQVMAFFFLWTPAVSLASFVLWEHGTISGTLALLLSAPFAALFFLFFWFKA